MTFNVTLQSNALPTNYPISRGEEWNRICEVVSSSIRPSAPNENNFHAYLVFRFRFVVNHVVNADEPRHTAAATGTARPQQFIKDISQSSTPTT